jgi:hypothetical protein
MDFLSIDHNFCEMNIYGQPPEYINSYSALFLCFIGFFGLIKNIRLNDTAFIYISLIVNGFASFMYHYTNQLGFGMLDRASMLMIIIYFCNLSFHIFEMYRFKYIDFLRIISTIYFTTLIMVYGLHYELLFDILFGVYLFTTIFFMVIIEYFYEKNEIPVEILNYGWISVGLITIAGIFWIITESYCNYHPIIKYLYGHAIWHICVSLGAYFMTILMTYLLVKNRKSKIKSFLFIPYIYYLHDYY